MTFFLGVGGGGQFRWNDEGGGGWRVPNSNCCQVNSAQDDSILNYRRLMFSLYLAISRTRDRPGDNTSMGDSPCHPLSSLVGAES